MLEGLENYHLGLIEILKIKSKQKGISIEEALNDQINNANI
mgnify:CR=1 FL=1